MKKMICIFLVAIMLLLHCSTVLANENDSEEISEDEIKEEILQTDSDSFSNPVINSKAAIVIDRKSKRILYSKNVNEKRAMASTTKIITCLIALENSKADDIITVSKTAASAYGSRLGLSKGDKITMTDLLYGLMLRSGNDAAAQIAETIGGSYEEFAKMMNKKAKEIGLKNTHFVTPHGLDNDEHYTTAYDLAILTDYALDNKRFAEIVSKKTKTILINGKQRELYNTNELLGVLEGVYGVKTGFTANAGRCLVVSCKRNGMDLISVVLGADTKKNRTKDSIQILEYAYKNYSYINLKEKIRLEFEKWEKDNRVKVIKGKEEYASTVLEEIYYANYPIKKGEETSIKITLECEKNKTAPIYQFEKLGTANVYISNEKIMEINIVAQSNVERKTPIDYLNIFSALGTRLVCGKFSV